MPNPEVKKTDIDARQANDRHMNLRVLGWSLAGVIILLGLVYAISQIAA